jgi:hypothetical protein
MTATAAADQQCPLELVHKTRVCREAQKADVVEHAEVFRHVGLLFNGSTGWAGLPFI